MALFTFSWDQFGLPLFRAESSHYDALGWWMITDISVYKLVALDALAMLADVAAGREPFDAWSSENYSVTFSPTGLSISANYSDSQGEYQVAEARQAVEEYWRFLVSKPDNPDVVREFYPDKPDWEANLLRWEDKWGRRHPYRGVLF
jgi:hypothetical protein